MGVVGGSGMHSLPDRIEDTREAVEEDNEAHNGGWDEPHGVESKPCKIHANCLTKIPPENTKYMGQWTKKVVANYLSLQLAQAYLI